MADESIARRFARQLRQNLSEAWSGREFERPVPDEPGVMAGYDRAPRIPANVLPAMERVRGRGLRDVAEAGYDWFGPLALYSAEAEGKVKPKGKAKGRQGAMTTLLRGEEILSGPRAKTSFRITPETPAHIRRAVEAPKEVGLEKLFKSGEKEGIYRGTEAFGGITPQQIGPMRSQYLRKMETGAPGRLWYDQTSEDILRLVGGDPAKADQLANMLATTSSRTPVGPNAMYGFKGWNQAAVGDPIRTGGFPQVMGKAIEDVLATPEASATGLKRSPFSAGLSVGWRGPEFANRPTHDIHDVRAWNITDPITGEPWSKGVGPAGHRFLDEQAEAVTRRANERALGGVEDWTPYRSQAAAWIAQKAAHEGIPIEQAAKHYGDYIDDYSALVTREWVPGENTGHLLEALRAPEAARRGFSEELEQVVRGPEDIDRLASEMGALSETVLPNRGVYEGATNPGYISRIPVGKATGGGAIDPSSAKLMDAIAAAHGLLGTQKQSAWNFAAGPSPISKANLLRINRGSPYSETELAQLQASVPGLDVPMADPKGARVLEFADPKARVKALREAGFEPEPQALAGNLLPESPEAYSTLPYIEAIERAGPKVEAGFSRAAQTMAPQILERTQKWAAQQGWTQAPWFADAMNALATGGLAKLKELQKAGVVPAAFVAGIEAQGEPNAT